MREITIGDKRIRVRATPLALLYYRQEFKSDLLSDIVKMRGVEDDSSRFDPVICLQITWAMAKADVGPGKSFPSFEEWLNSLEGIDLSDSGFLLNVMDEVTDGFFRGAKLG